MSLAIPRDAAPPAWHASPYLLSAACVLLGCYLLGHSAQDLPSVADLRTVLGTQVGYSACLLAVAAWLIHRGGNRRDGLLLLALLLVFTLDAQAIQHLYGWTSSDGRRAAWVGALSGVLLLAGAAKALGHAPWSRLALTGISAALFVRFGGFALAGAAPADPAMPYSPPLVVLGWLLAACLLPTLVLPAPRAVSDRARLEESVGLMACIAFPAAHLALIGFSLALPSRIAYFAPLMILAPAFAERAWPELRDVRWRRIVLDATPLVAVVSTATFFSPSLIEADWARHLPLTPYLLAMIGATASTALRAWRLRHVGFAHVAAGLAAVALLGGDMPEMLARLRYPDTWQALVVATICWLAMAIGRRFEPGLCLHGLASFVAASWLAETWGIPWLGGFVVLLAFGLLAHARACGRTLPLRERLPAMAAVVIAALASLALEHDALPRLVFVLGAAALLAALSLVRRDRLVLVALAALLVGTCAIEAIGVQRVGEVSPGRLLIELGFLLLLLAALRSMLGTRLSRSLHSWLRPDP